MTIRDLLTHRAGLSLGAGDLLFWPSTTFSRKEIVERLRFIKPSISFRIVDFSYDFQDLLLIPVKSDQR